MSKIKKCKICGRKYKSSKTYEECMSDKICSRCMDNDMKEFEANKEYQYACGGVELFF